MKRDFLAALLLLVAGVQTTMAQKIVLHMTGNQKVEYDISQLDSITFEGDDLIIGEEHEWVDLGLPSGTLWATCNVGANSPEEYGDYFAWGETEPKNFYNWNTYKYCMGDYNTMTKYCPQSDFGYNGFTDNLTELVLEDDAAAANWGNGWQMPSMAQFRELFNSDYTTTEWMAQDSVKGRKITSNTNGKSIFLPAAGFSDNRPNVGSGIYGYYWSRSLSKLDDSEDGYCAFGLCFEQSNFYLDSDWLRLYGLSIRPIRVKR